MRSWFWLFIFILILGCKSKPVNLAPDKNFYFTVESDSTSETSKNTKQYLEENIPAHKYAITNSSGYHWPFYQVFDLDETVLVDSLMPPHWYVHKLIPFKENQKAQEDEFLVKIEIFVVPDTIPNYRVTIFREKENEFQLSAQTDLHFIQPSEFKSQAELSELFLKNILRYSFK